MNRAQWDRLAGKFETQVCDIADQETDDYLERFVKLAKVPAGGVLVDLGCGIGTFIAKFGAPFREIVGVEFAPRIIARAKQRCAGMKGISWLTLDIPRAAARIGRKSDFTVCLNVITQQSEVRRAALWASLAAVTRRGGHTLVVIPSLEAERLIEKVSGGNGATIHAGGLVDRDGDLQKHFTRRELEEIFAANGFAVKRIGRARYSWTEEGVRETKARAKNRPWDWMCLAQRL
jgi:SAM-dependent methyltransferase